MQNLQNLEEWVISKRVERAGRAFPADRAGSHFPVDVPDYPLGYGLCPVVPRAVFPEMVPGEFPRARRG